MAKRVILAAVGVVYAAAAVWLVHSQGESYRLALRGRTQARPLARAPEEAGPQRSARHTASIEGPRPAAIRPEARAVHDDPKPAALPTAPAQAPASVRPAPEPAPRPYESPVKLKPLVIAGLETASTADEAVFGDALNKLVLINHPAVEDSGARERVVRESAQPMIDLRTRKDVEIKIVVLDSDDVNAFSHLGGYIYVTRGLMSFAGTEEEFQFVIGHELGHIDLKHGRELVASLTKDGTVARLGTLQALYQQIARGYTEAQELAADDWAVDRMLKLDCTPRECLMYLRKLRRLSEEQNFREGRKAPKPPPEATTQDIGNHLRSAPAAWTRLGRLETRLNATPARPGVIGPSGKGR